MFELKGIRVGFFCSTADGKITTNRKFKLSKYLILEAKQKEKAVEKLLSELYIYLDAKP